MVCFEMYIRFKKSTYVIHLLSKVIFQKKKSLEALLNQHCLQYFSVYTFNQCLHFQAVKLTTLALLSPFVLQEGYKFIYFSVCIMLAPALRQFLEAKPLSFVSYVAEMSFHNS